MNASAYFQEISRKRPIVGFAGVGLLSTLLDLLSLKLGLTLHLPVWLATAVGFSVGLANGYLLKQRFRLSKSTF